MKYIFFDFCNYYGKNLKFLETAFKLESQPIKYIYMGFGKLLIIKTK